MRQHWCSLRPLLSCILLLSSAYAGPAFDNTAIVRTVELGGTIVHVTTTYAVKALEPGSQLYTVALDGDSNLRTSSIEVKLKGQQKALKMREQGLDPSGEVYLFDVELPEPLSVNGTVNLVLETVETHATYPWPAHASQEDSQAVKYHPSLFVLSPYHTHVQRTKIRLPTPKVISYTEIKELSTFTLEAPVTKSGGTITYGPYNNVPPSANKEFIEEHQKSLTIHYGYDHPLVEVLTSNRTAEISHWGSNLNIQDDYHLYNAGPQLKGHFSRILYQTQQHFGNPAPHIIHGLGLHLPSGIRNTYYYDQIGNVSTSRLRAAPSVSRKAPSYQYSVLELRPRYPVLGGWNYSFTVGWDAPLEDSVSYDAKNNRYIVGLPIMSPLPGAITNNIEVNLIMPEGATDIEIYPPLAPLETVRWTHTTYLDTSGRPAVTLKYKDMVDKRNGIIYVTYQVSSSAHLRKPVAVSLAFMTVFLFAIFGRRLNLSLNEK